MHSANRTEDVQDMVDFFETYPEMDRLFKFHDVISSLMGEHMIRN